MNADNNVAATLRFGSKKSEAAIQRSIKRKNYSYRDQRLAIKSELSIRTKALSNSEFPSQAIIDEFLIRPVTLPKLDLTWKQPNVVKFMVIRNLKGKCCFNVRLFSCFAAIYDKTTTMERDLLFSEIFATINEMANISFRKKR